MLDYYPNRPNLALKTVPVVCLRVNKREQAPLKPAEPVKSHGGYIELSRNVTSLAANSGFFQLIAPLSVSQSLALRISGEQYTVMGAQIMTDDDP